MGAPNPCSTATQYTICRPSRRLGRADVTMYLLCTYYPPLSQVPRSNAGLRNRKSLNNRPVLPALKEAKKGVVILGGATLSNSFVSKAGGVRLGFTLVGQLGRLLSASKKEKAMCHR